MMIDIFENTLKNRQKSLIVWLDNGVALFDFAPPLVLFYKFYRTLIDFDCL